MVDRGKAMTNEQIKARTTLWHPQVMKDLMDCKLIARVGKSGNEFAYVADRKGRGILPTEVRVRVELIEDEKGYFHAKAFVEGSTQIPNGGVRKIAERGLTFVIPLEGEIEDPRYTRNVTDNVIEGSATEIISDPSYMIIDQ